MAPAEVNSLEEEEFVARFGAVFEHSPWVAERAWHRRPFSSLEDLHRAMTTEVREARFDERSPLQGNVHLVNSSRAILPLDWSMSSAICKSPVTTGI